MKTLSTLSLLSSLLLTSACITDGADRDATAGAPVQDLIGETRGLAIEHPAPTHGRALTEVGTRAELLELIEDTAPVVVSDHRIITASDDVVTLDVALVPPTGTFGHGAEVIGDLASGAWSLVVVDEATNHILPCEGTDMALRCVVAPSTGYRIVTSVSHLADLRRDGWVRVDPVTVEVTAGGARTSLTATGRLWSAK